MWTIYRLTSPSGKHYVGLSKNVARRMREYKRYAKSKPQTYIKTGQVLILNALRKYGFDAFSVSILETDIPSLAVASEREKFFISTNQSFQLGYNLTLGGAGGDHPPIPERWIVDGQLVVPHQFHHNPPRPRSEYEKACSVCYIHQKEGRWKSTPEHDAVKQSITGKRKRDGRRRQASTLTIEIASRLDGLVVAPKAIPKPVNDYEVACNRLYYQRRLAVRFGRPLPDLTVDQIDVLSKWQRKKPARAFLDQRSVA